MPPILGNTTTTGENAAATLTGAELVRGVQGGDNVKMTTAAIAGLGFQNPSMAKGDLIVQGSAAPLRFSIGTDGYTVYADSTQLTGMRWGIAGVLPADLASASVGTKGAGLVGINPFTQNYVLGTIGAILQDQTVNALWFATSEARRQAIKNSTFANDNTAELQAAFTWASQGRAIYIPWGWHVNGTITVQQGQKVLGDNWATVTLTYGCVAGSSVVQQYSTADIPTFNVPGVSESDQFENVQFRGLAVKHVNDSNSLGSAIEASFARKILVENCYFSGFNRAVWLTQQCWGFRMDHIQVLNCNIGFEFGSASEDGLVINCDLGLFRSNPTGATTTCIQLTNQTQNIKIISTGMHFCDYGVFLQQGDTSGAGTGTPYPMQVSIDGCYFEDQVLAAVAMTASAGSAPATQHPSLSLTNSRVFCGGAFATPNTGQAIVYAEHASQIYVNNISEGGFSYGGVFNHALFGRFVNGVDVGNVIWGQDDAYTYGTSRFLGSTKQITFLRGKSPMCRLGTTATTIALSGGFGNPSWNTTISDFWTWGNTSTSMILPSRIEPMRVSCSLMLTATVSGARYALNLFRNGSQVATLVDMIASGTGALKLAGDWIDFGSGAAGDAYAVQLVCSSGSSVTITPGGCVFTVELVGN